MHAEGRFFCSLFSYVFLFVLDHRIFLGELYLLEDERKKGKKIISFWIENDVIRKTRKSNSDEGFWTGKKAYKAIIKRLDEGLFNFVMTLCLSFKLEIERIIHKHFKIIPMINEEANIQ